MTTLFIRTAEPSDEDVLRFMFVEAAFWNQPKIPFKEMLRNPALARYFSDWGRAGDLALIAIKDPVPLGAAWYRFFSANEPGYGFVRDDIPELGIAVWPAARGRGIGRALLIELQATAKEHGHPGLSLSVHPDNPARRLYESLDFEETARNETAVTMLWRNVDLQ